MTSRFIDGRLAGSLGRSNEVVTHPNRGKVYPNTLLAERCREAGATVRLVWEERGPKNSNVAFLTCYLINQTLCIVATYSDGWDAYTPCQSLKVDDAIADVFARCGVKS